VGLPALPEALTRLEAAAKAAEEERKGLLELLDRAAGVAEKRARLHRLRSRKSRLGREDLEEEARALERELEPVDQAIAEGDAAFFLRGDPEAREAEARLAELADRFQENERRWKSELGNRPPPRGPFWRTWLQGILVRLELAKPRAGQGGEETRKTLCDRAWKLLHEAWAEEAKQLFSLLDEAYVPLFRALQEAGLPPPTEGPEDVPTPHGEMIQSLARWGGKRLFPEGSGGEGLEVEPDTPVERIRAFLGI